ncbi:MAG: hypothetical protein Kow0068_11450 [Marinilabiliales bacterium]
MKRIIAFSVFIISVIQLNAQKNDLLNNLINNIKASELFEIVDTLSSKEMRGRLSGTEGYNKAAIYASKIFKDLNLKPITKEGYYQFFNIECNEIKEPCYISDETTKFKLGTDFVCRGFTGSGNIASEVVFCGYGIKNGEYYNDYANIDVNGKIVLIFKQNPDWKINNEDWKYVDIRQKVALARDNGAIGVLFVSVYNNGNPQKPIGSVMAGKGEHLSNIPQVHITPEVANNFLKNTGFEIYQLQTLIDSNKKPKSLQTGRICSMNINAKYTPSAKTMNVGAIMEGTDSLLKNEYVIICAHLDHVGTQGDSLMFPGANDNASGSAGVLQIAKAFVNSGIQPKRSIIFLLFASEEHGLDGSEYFADNMPVPVEQVTAMLNMDCIAYGDSIRVGCGKSFPKLWNIAKTSDDKFIKRMVDATWSGGGADATAFFNKKIPTLYFVTTNSYKYLHLPGDKPETLNLPLFESIVKLAAITLYNIADGNYIKENIDIK